MCLPTEELLSIVHWEGYSFFITDTVLYPVSIQNILCI